MNKMFTCAKWNKLHLFQVSTYVLWVVFLFPKICFNQTFNGQEAFLYHQWGALVKPLQ